MATILPFAKVAPTRSRAAGERSGMIVIFPGIRVEYHDDPVPPPRRKRGGTRKRSKAADA